MNDLKWNRQSLFEELGITLPFEWNSIFNWYFLEIKVVIGQIEG
jgi:hypothetical protein